VVRVKNTLGIKDKTSFWSHVYYHFLLIERVGLAKFGEKTLHHGPHVYSFCILSLSNGIEDK